MKMKKIAKTFYNGWDITKGDYEISEDSTETYRAQAVRKKRLKKVFSIILYFVILILVTIVFVAPL